jgi:hypothetical protein
MRRLWLLFSAKATKNERKTGKTESRYRQESRNAPGVIMAIPLKVFRFSKCLFPEII